MENVPTRFNFQPYRQWIIEFLALGTEVVLALLTAERIKIL